MSKAFTIIFALFTSFFIGCESDSPTKSEQITEPEVSIKLKVDTTSTYLYKITEFEGDVLIKTSHQYFQIKDNEPNTMYFKGTELIEGEDSSNRINLSDNSFYKTMDTLDINSLRVIQNEILYGTSPFLVQYNPKYAKIISVKSTSLNINGQEFESELIKYSSKNDADIIIQEWIGQSYVLKRQAEQTIDGKKSIVISEYYGNKTQAKSLNLID